MNTYHLSMLVLVFGGLLYHLSQKLVPPDQNLFVILLHAYVVAALLCLVVIASSTPKTMPSVITRPHVVSLLLGLAVALIEAGFLLAYRSGWSVGWAALYTSVLVTSILLPVGCFFFQERLSPSRLAGIFLCLVGLLLLTRR